LIEYAPYSKRAPESQFKIGQCFALLNKDNDAFREYEMILVNYPHTRQYLEALLEIGKLSFLCAFAAESREDKNNMLNKSLMAFKNAYRSKRVARLSREEEKDIHEKAANGIARTLMSIDMSMTRATAFLKYHYYGKKGKDGRLGTSDDLINPLDIL
jgi:hypothetical protein